LSVPRLVFLTEHSLVLRWANYKGRATSEIVIFRRFFREFARKHASVRGQLEKASIRLTGVGHPFEILSMFNFGKLLALRLSVDIPKRRIGWCSGGGGENTPRPRFFLPLLRNPKRF